MSGIDVWQSFSRSVALNHPHLGLPPSPLPDCEVKDSIFLSPTNGRSLAWLPIKNHLFTHRQDSPNALGMDVLWRTDGDSWDISL